LFDPDTLEVRDPEENVAAEIRIDGGLNRDFDFTDAEPIAALLRAAFWREIRDEIADCADVRQEPSVRRSLALLLALARLRFRLALQTFDLTNDGDGVGGASAVGAYGITSSPTCAIALLRLGAYRDEQ
jgi:hypothetical protein